MAVTLRAYRPGIDGPWGEAEAAHLLERAGFGGTPEEIRELVRLGPAGAVDWVMGAVSASDVPVPGWVEAWDRERRRPRDGLTEEQRRQRRTLGRGSMRDLQGWWLRRMGEGPCPLQEKLTLFWHSHFATSAEKVDDPVMMWEQQQRFRALGMGPFADLVQAVCRDAAMIRFLDSESNVSGRPNENFARELMELYTLGEGNYTEEDVREASRALTGWHIRDFQGDFDERRHDGGVKTLLGETGRFGDRDVVGILMKQPAMARFISHKLFEFFVAYRPGPRLREALAEAFTAGSYRVGDYLRMLFRSQLFYIPKVRLSLIKSPAQYVVGTLRRLPGRRPPEPVLLQAMRQMGQEVLWPPDVDGWKEGVSWIHTHALTMRYHFAYYLATGELPAGLRAGDIESAGGPLLDVGPFVDNMTATREDQCARELAAHLFGQPLPQARLAGYAEYLRTGSNGARVSFDLRKAVSAERFLGVAYLMLSSPEYQMC